MTNPRFLIEAPPPPPPPPPKSTFIDWLSDPKTIPNIVRTGTGLAGSLLSTEPGLGTLAGGTVGGGGEALAEFMEGTKLNPARIAGEAGVAALPFGKFMKAGNIPLSTGLGAVYSGLGMEGRKIANNQPLSLEGNDVANLSTGAAMGGLAGYIGGRRPSSGGTTSSGGAIPGTDLGSSPTDVAPHGPPRPDPKTATGLRIAINDAKNGKILNPDEHLALRNTLYDPITGTPRQGKIPSELFGPEGAPPPATAKDFNLAEQEASGMISKEQAVIRKKQAQLEDAFAKADSSRDTKISGLRVKNAQASNKAQEQANQLLAQEKLDTEASHAEYLKSEADAKAIADTKANSQPQPPVVTERISSGDDTQTTKYVQPDPEGDGDGGEGGDVEPKGPKKTAYTSKREATVVAINNPGHHVEELDKGSNIWIVVKDKAPSAPSPLAKNAAMSLGKERAEVPLAPDQETALGLPPTAPVDPNGALKTRLRKANGGGQPANIVEPRPPAPMPEMRPDASSSPLDLALDSEPPPQDPPVGEPLAWSPDQMVDTPEGSTLPPESGAEGTPHITTGKTPEEIKALQAEAMARVAKAQEGVSLGQDIPAPKLPVSGLRVGGTRPDTVPEWVDTSKGNPETTELGEKDFKNYYKKSNPAQSLAFYYDKVSPELQAKIQAVFEASKGKPKPADLNTIQRLVQQELGDAWRTSGESQLGGQKWFEEQALNDANTAQEGTTVPNDPNAPPSPVEEPPVAEAPPEVIPTPETPTSDPIRQQGSIPVLSKPLDEMMERQGVGSGQQPFEKGQNVASPPSGLVLSKNIEGSGPVNAKTGKPREWDKAEFGDALPSTSKPKVKTPPKDESAPYEPSTTPEKVSTPQDQIEAAKADLADPNTPDSVKEIITEWLKGVGASETTGEMTPEMAIKTMLSMSGGLLGGYEGYKNDPLGNKWASGLGGALLGASVPTIGMELPQIAEALGRSTGSTQWGLKQLNKLHNTGLLSPLSVAKKALGDIGGVRDAGLDHPERIGSIIKSLLSKENLVSGARDFKEGWTAPPSEAETGFENFIDNAKNPLSWSGKAMGGLTKATKGLLQRSGFSPEEAKYYTFTNQPDSHLGKNFYNLWSPKHKAGDVMQHLSPFARININRLERGWERSPLGLLDLRSAKSDEERLTTLKRAFMGTGAAVVAHHLTPENYVKDHPTKASLITALSGLYGLPVLAGMAMKGHGPDLRVDQAARALTKDIPGFRFAEEISSSPMAYVRNYLSGYTNISRPIAEGISKLRGKNNDPDVNSKSLKFPGSLVNQTLANIPMVRDTLPQKQQKLTTSPKVPRFRIIK